MSLIISKKKNQQKDKSKGVADHKKLLTELRILTKGDNELEPFQEFFDDRFLMHFIHGKKYDVDKAFIGLQNYISIRKGKERDLFQGMRPSNCTLLNEQTCRVLKYKDQLNRLVILDRVRMWDPDRCDSEDVIKFFILGLEEIWNCEEAESNGVVFIMDFNGCGFRHIRSATPSLIYRLINILFTNFPLRVQNVHLINELGLVNVVLKTVKPFFPKKFKDRINCHGHSMESLHEHIPQEILPEELGGNLSEEDCFENRFEANILAKEDYYDKFAAKL